ncbi:MAG: phosphotransacetylase family protein [Elainellaceae cyanobacterium]
MVTSAKCLIVGSTKAYSGKSATVLGIAFQAQKAGLTLAYGKPLSSETGSAMSDEDSRCIAETLGIVSQPTLLSLNPQTIQKRMLGDDSQDYPAQLQRYRTDSDLVILEGPGTLREGTLFDLAVEQMAQVLDAQVLLVTRYEAISLVDSVLVAKAQLGDRLCGVVINDVPADDIDSVKAAICPFLAAKGIPVYGVLPHSEILMSVSVRELVHQLKAEVLCRSDRLNLMVETLKIGAMNVNSALKYFRKARHMAVVTGGDRTDLQLAALETSTHCLILTGHIAPTQEVLNRAEDLEVPILTVDLDTLTTVEIIEKTFGHVNLHDAIKVQYIREMTADELDVARLLEHLGLSTAAAV